MEARAVKWELDNDDIASIDSEELHAHRPNRWTGPPSTWRALTEEERNLWQSMKQLQDQDLSVHLYNAFALKKRGRSQAMAKTPTVQTGSSQEAPWAPPKQWTAWPLKERHLPKEQLFQPQHDEDERYTFRRVEETHPSTELENELSATILRRAKERFVRRQTKMVRPSIEESTPMTEPECQGSSSTKMLFKKDDEEEDEDEMDVDDKPPPPPPDTDESQGHVKRPPRTYAPVFSADDDFSYHLLRPSVRHILSQLDTTLTILHNSRVAGLNYLSDSSTEDDSDTQQTGPKRPRGRPRNTSRTQTPVEDAGATTPTGRKRGRPRKVHVPREGETEEEMRVRIAREAHRRIPTTEAERTAAFEAWLKQGEQASKDEAHQQAAASSPASTSTSTNAPSPTHKPPPPAPPDTDTDSNASTTTNISRKRRRWGLRDWSDMLGAAALAGFSPSALARASRRCAALFNEGMVLHTLNEVPVSHASSTGIAPQVFRPGPITLSVSDSDSEDDAAAPLAQRRVASRQASLARRSTSPPSTPRGRRSATPHSPSSRSSSAAGLLVFCPIPSCERAAQGFTRRTNLRRHMDLVHGGSAAAAPEVDSDEETLGAVHVDGFLRPVVPGRGWRGEDAALRRRKRHYRGRRVVEGDGEASS